MTYHLIFLLLAIQIRDLITGHHMIIMFNSKLPTSCFIIIRCLPGILTLCSTSGPHLLPSTMMNPHSLTLQICITPLILLPLVTSPGNLLVYSIMACSRRGSVMDANRVWCVVQRSTCSRSQSPVEPRFQIWFWLHVISREDYWWSPLVPRLHVWKLGLASSCKFVLLYY